MCKGKKCLGKNETNKLNFLERKWHRKSDIMNARRWDLFQFAYFTTNLCTSPPWQMREDRRLIFIPELWKRNKEKFQSVTLKKLRSLLKGAVSRLPNSFCFLCPNVIHASPPPLPHGYCGAFAYLFSPGGGAFAIFALLGDRAFANSQGYSRAFDTHAVRICPLFSSPPRVIWQLKSPHPQEFGTKPKKNC